MRDHFQESPRSYSEDWVGWCCSYCGEPLVPGGAGFSAARRNAGSRRVDGVHLLLPEERRQSLLAFREIRRRVERAPARREEDEEWRRHVAEALGLVREGLGPGPWYVLAAGDGPAARSLRAGHRVVVVSSRLDPEDARETEASRCPRAEAELDALPLEPGRADLVVAEGSLHEGPSLSRTLSSCGASSGAGASCSRWIRRYSAGGQTGKPTSRTR